jgi:hypothetical protein
LTCDCIQFKLTFKNPNRVKLNWATTGIYPNLKLSWTAYEPINAAVQKN